MVTPEKAASWLGVTPRTVTKWLREGTLQGVKIGNRWRISESALQDLVAEQTEWVLSLRIDPLSGTLVLGPDHVPTLDPDEDLDLPDEWWEELAQMIPDEGGWGDVKSHIRAALQNRAVDEEAGRLDVEDREELISVMRQKGIELDQEDAEELLVMIKPEVLEQLRAERRAKGEPSKPR